MLHRRCLGRRTRIDVWDSGEQNGRMRGATCFALRVGEVCGNGVGTTMVTGTGAKGAVWFHWVMSLARDTVGLEDVSLSWLLC